MSLETNNDVKFNEVYSMIPTYENFIKGLEAIREQQLVAREQSESNLYPFPANEKGEVSVFSTGVITPKDSHYLINSDGSLSFTKTIHSFYEDKEIFPPFSCAEFLLESENDFSIDLNQAAEYYNTNKELAIKEFTSVTSRDMYRPIAPISEDIGKQFKEVKELLDDPQKIFSKEEVQSLLDDHFTKIEKMLTEYTSKIETAPKHSLIMLQRELKDRIIEAFNTLKTNLQQRMLEFKDRTKNNIENKVDDVRLSVHNAISSRVQSVNDKIKIFTNALDERYQVIERPDPKDLEQHAAKEPISSATQEEQGITHELDQKESLKQVNLKLEKENQGLKTFVTKLKESHPDVYQNVYQTLKQLSNNELPQQKTNVKQKEKEVIEL